MKKFSEVFLFGIFFICFSFFLRCFISELAHLLESNLLAQQVDKGISNIGISSAVGSIC